MKNLEIKLFLLIAFFIGTWGALFEVLQTILIAVGLLYNIVKYRTDFLCNLRRYKVYVSIPLAAVLYFAVHSLWIVHSGRYAGFKPGFGLFEKEILVFLLGTLYVISLKSFLTVKLLKQFLVCFCVSVFTFNLVMLFDLTGWGLFTDTRRALNYLYESRFGFTKYFLGGKVYLDAEALHIYAAAIISWFFAITWHKNWQRIVAFLFFVLFVWFLSLTVTKSSILSFLCGFFIFNLYILRKLALRFRLILIGFFVVAAVGVFVFRPASFDRRWQQTVEEFRDVRNGNLGGGGSIVPRYVFYKSCFDNIDSWGVWGLGAYTNPVSKEWYLNSGNTTVAALVHSHNSYLQYWMLMGIFGLLFILSWFVLPVYQMICSRQYSFLALSLLIAFFIDSNFEVLLIVNDALVVVTFFLMMFYVHGNKFHELEDVSLPARRAPKAA